MSNDERPLPQFFRQWRGMWEDPEDWSPLDYLNQDSALPAVILSAWLFCPETVTHRGGVFLRNRFSEEGADRWLEHFRGDVGRAETMVNQTVFYDFFVNCDLDTVSEAELQQFAECVGECWRGVLSARYPDRHVTVEVTGEAEKAYGPTVTFWTEPKVPSAADIAAALG